MLVPLGTNLTALAPAITVSKGAGIEPASGVSRNFTGPLTYTVTAEDGSTAAWTVTVEDREPLYSVSAIENYLSTAQGGADAGDPVPLLVNINLADPGENGWTDLLSAISGAGKYVALDLSACTMGEGVTEFDPGAANTGEQYVASLVLPGTAKTIKAGTDYSDSTFKNFTNLANVTGSGVTGVGDSAFSGCTALTSVSFPAAASIGDSAFSGCSALASVDLPAAASIGDAAFAGCDTLTTVSLPVAASIGDAAFVGCDTLTSVSLPAATGIGVRAFYDCFALTSVDLPAATGIGNYAFQDCFALTSASLPAATGIGNYAFQNCAALTSASLPEATGIGNDAFAGCASLTSVSLPAAASIGDSAFSGCTALTSVSLPAAESIGGGAFSSIGITPLTVTLGSTAPTLGTNMFNNVNSAKTVKVRIPSTATGYGSAPANTTGNNWGNAFRGKGWNGTSYRSGTVNGNITLTFETYNP